MKKGDQTIATGLSSKLRQCYRYYRNWQKYKRPSAKRKERLSKELKFYSQFIQKNDLCFDIGANIGDKTEVFLKLGAAVVAVEPQESCWRVLRRRFKNNNVYVIAKALDKTAENKEIFIDRSHTISSMSKEWIDSVKRSGRFSKHKWNYKITIETTTLDTLIGEYGNPVFCKIDVEGYEFEVIQGLSQPARMLSFEFIPEFINPVLDCIRYLSQLGPAEFNYSLAESEDFVLPGWVNADDMAEILTCLPSKLPSQGDIYAKFTDHRI